MQYLGNSGNVTGYPGNKQVTQVGGNVRHPTDEYGME
jgi:hypothetical protein